ncbi:hypothetical protein N7533_013463 [Penicillium manginii]|uniref:uncharacterized protein n=1 Tax=Penicillium manginii TaxID=203109 RepID=UPI0025494CD8|nr:uncharacterized protein N7533_013463 [Penicillium manginii]KAJ5733016.1 hypothetical protein N7533_013463 [Penicillium manginii]
MKRLSRVFSSSPKTVPTQSRPAAIVPENPKLTIEGRSIDEGRPLRIVVIGAGISGILSCIRFRQRIPNIEICVYEKNPDIGGTWFENRYPGCACDIPAHTYQATFEPNKEWSTFYARAPEIHKYWKHVAEKYGCMKYIKLKQQVNSATWDERSSKWKLEIQDLDSGSSYTDEGNIVIQGTGSLNNWKWPEIPGLDEFKGKLLHSASWDEGYDYSNQRVAVIGNGSSGIQIVPGILPKVTHIDHYMRSRTWVSPTFAREYIEKHGNGNDNFTFSPEDIEEFKNNHEAYQKFRKGVELELQSIHGATLNGHPMQLGAHEAFVENMKRRLANKPELIDDLIPAFPPACRRLTPGPGYLEALTDEKVDIIKSDIAKIDEKGIITADGQHRAVDAIVCATGFDTTCTPRFTIRGRDGVLLSERWKETPETYIAVATDGFPNYFISLGPNAALGEGNLLLLIEKEVDYFTIRCNGIILELWLRAKKQYASFDGTVMNISRTRYLVASVAVGTRGGTEEGRIVALWPGSSLHAMKVFAQPRWEDYEYEYVNDNPFGWIGDGWTENEKNDKIHVNYLDDDQVDFPAAK